MKTQLSIASFLVTTAFYSAHIGIWFALGFITLLLIHELGHVYALWQYDRKIRLPFFIPFLGAVVFGDKDCQDLTRNEEARIAYLGPLFGTIAALCAAAPYMWTHNTFWLMLGVAGVALNLFNMIPVSPLDGGRITQAIDTRFFYVGFALLVVLSAILLSTTTMFLIALIISQRYRHRQAIVSVYAGGTVIVFMVLTMVATSVNAHDILLCIITLFVTIGLYAEYLESKQQGPTNSSQPATGVDLRPVGDRDDRLNWGASYLALLVTQMISL
jgi:Zn-dependent protease